MVKTRIGERLSHLKAEDSATKKSRSLELADLTVKYLDFTKSIKTLGASLKSHHAVMKKFDQSQEEVLEGLSVWVKNTHIMSEDNNAVKVQQEMLKKDKLFSKKYEEEIIDYVHEWQLVTSTRVEACQKHVKELQSDLSHYDKKVESLTKSHDATLAKEDTPKDKDVEKLKRNEQKLAIAKDQYESQASHLCNLLDEVVICAWKDVLPLLIRMMKLESAKLDEQRTAVESTQVLENMKKLAVEHEIDITNPPPGSADTKAAPKEKETKKTDKESPEKKESDC